MPETRKIVLSFDDGPAPIGALHAILSVLQNNGINAEFYVLGSEVEKYPDAARLIVSRGHRIQNHSWSHSSHPNLAKASEETVRSELERTQEIVKKSNRCNSN